jgi:hypothetical protein
VAAVKITKNATTAALRSRSESSFALSAGTEANWSAGVFFDGRSGLGYAHGVNLPVMPQSVAGVDTRTYIAAKQAIPPRGIPR